jgi:hypothetical protein
VPLFVTVKVFAALVCPIATEPNARDAGVTAIGAIGVPVRLSTVVSCVTPMPYETSIAPVICSPAVTPSGGEKVALMTQLPEPGTLPPQVSLSPNVVEFTVIVIG